MTMALAAPSLLAACGGTRQDAHEPSGTFDVRILKASFPTQQAIAQPSTLRIAVQNAGRRAIPDLAVTVNSFNRVSSEVGLADPSRPVWIVDEGPPGGDSAYSNTWALGGLAPGHVRVFTWHVTAVVPGRWTIRYRVAAGLNGKARAALPGGGVPAGTFRVSISGAGAQSRVDPNTGRVIRSAPSQASPPAAGGGGGAPAQGYGSQGPSSQQPGSGTGSQPGAGAGAAPGG